MMCITAKTGRSLTLLWRSAVTTLPSYLLRVKSTIIFCLPLINKGTEERGRPELLHLPQSPLRSGSPQSPLRSGSPQSPLRSGSPQSPLRSGSPQSPLRSGSPQSPLRSGSPQSPLRSGSPQSPLRSGSPQSPLRSGSPQSPLRSGSPQSPLQPLRAVQCRLLPTNWLTPPWSRMSQPSPQKQSGSQ